MNGGTDVASTMPCADGSSTIRDWTVIGGSRCGADLRDLAQEGEQPRLTSAAWVTHDVRAALDLT